MIVEIPQEAIESIAQQGKYYYENSILINSLEAGHCDAYVDLDIYNQVDEINEDNNTLLMTFTVRPILESLLFSTTRPLGYLESSG